MKTFTLSLLFLLAIGSASVRADDARKTQEVISSHFPYPPALRPQVEFWKKIFAKHSRFEVVLHDSENMQIYKVLDFRWLRDEEGLDDGLISEMRQEHTKLAIEQLRSTLLKLHQCNLAGGCSDLSSEEKRIWNLYKESNNPEKFLLAAGDDRIRSQTGIKERFRQGVQVSRRYIKTMEAIFRREGLPVELTRLPLIESSFNLEAYSKVGAAGIWQFMPSTGRMYAMQVNNTIDERRDPLIATEAAARFLRANYEKLGTWPLAITAYNHGPAGVAAGVSTVGSSDIANLIRYYRGPAFGFSSRNFYAEFLAALIVEKNYAHHFGELDMDAPVTYDEVYVDFPIPLGQAARCAETDTEAIIALNPAFGSGVRQGQIPVPRNYQLRVPIGTASTFTSRYAAWQIEEKERLAALERARQARLAALKARRHKRVVSAKGGKRVKGAVIRVSDGRGRGRRG